MPDPAQQQTWDGDPYLLGRKAWEAGKDESPPFGVARRENGAELFAMGWEDAKAEGEPRRELIKVSGVVDMRSGWRQRLGK